MSERRLPSTAYEPKEGEAYVPLTAGQNLHEFTLRAVLSGIVLGVVFGGDALGAKPGDGSAESGVFGLGGVEHGHLPL